MNPNDSEACLLLPILFKILFSKGKNNSAGSE